MNAYEMLTDLRDNTGESAAAHWSDRELLRKLSAAQHRLAMTLMLSPGDWLMTSTPLTPVASVITLPTDCAKPVYMESTSTGSPIPIRGTVRERRMTRPETTTFFSGVIEAYFVGNTLEINQSGFTDQVTLWYQQRVTNLIAGTADTGSGANAIILPTSIGPSYVDDYYNSVVIEIVEGLLVGTIDTITDYTASTRSATITGTADTTTIFGSRSVLPEECHDYIVTLATTQVLAKPSSDLDVEIFKYWTSLLSKAKRDFEEWIATRESGSAHVRITEYT